MAERGGGELRPPGVVDGREVAGARRVAAVGEGRRTWSSDVLGDVVVREQHPGDSLGVLGFVMAEPAELGCGEGGDEHAADGLSAGGLSAPFLDEFLGGVGGAGVVPEEGVSDRYAVRVERDHPVLLATDRDRRGLVLKPGACHVVRRQPSARIDLGAGWVSGGAALHDRPVIGSTSSALVDCVDESTPRTRGMYLLSTSLELMSRHASVGLWAVVLTAAVRHGESYGAHFTDHAR